MTKEETKVLYEGKFFYKIIYSEIDGEQTKILLGPFDNIYYVNKVTNSLGEVTNTEYEFMQVIDGKPVQAFKKNEILVTDHIL